MDGWDRYHTEETSVCAHYVEQSADSSKEQVWVIKY